MRDLWSKATRRVRREVVSRLRHSSIYPKLYRSYWHQLFSNESIAASSANFLTAVPHPGAGIGHQLANWIAGYWFAMQFGLRFAHSPFASEAWDDFLGLREGEVTIDDALKQGYRKALLPLFDEADPHEVAQTRRIIHSYGSLKTLFVLEQDQFYAAQHGVIEDLKRKFHTAPARAHDTLVYDTRTLNIALHVRRGDVSAEAASVNPNLALRWQSESYFETVLSGVLEALGDKSRTAIYLFSQGREEEFSSFTRFPNLRLCLDMDARASFLHMSFADLLITSKSSFSYNTKLR